MISRLGIGRGLFFVLSLCLPGSSFHPHLAGLITFDLFHAASLSFSLDRYISSAITGGGGGFAIFYPVRIRNSKFHGVSFVLFSMFRFKARIELQPWGTVFCIVVALRLDRKAGTHSLPLWYCLSSRLTSLSSSVSWDFFVVFLGWCVSFLMV